MEVEIREEPSSSGYPSDSSATPLVNNTSPSYATVAEGPVVIVRVEEVLLVVLVLMIWVAAIALFFNRWGKIRMLEPYQPKFNQEPHRPSCPMAPLSPPGIGATQRMSFSKYNVNAMTDPLSVLPSPIIKRQRQNSVFVGSSATMAILNTPPRRAKSAMDIQHLIITNGSDRISPTRKGSMVPMVLNRDRRPSITVDRPPPPPRRRPSVVVAADRRRTSCSPIMSSQPSTSAVIPRLHSHAYHPHHRNFTSFDQPSSSSSFRTTHVVEELTCVTVEVPPPSLAVITRPPQPSKSFEQPSCSERPTRPERMANSLDVSAVTFDCGVPPVDIREEVEEEEEGERGGSSVFADCLDDSRITAPLLEGLKSSDV